MISPEQFMDYFRNVEPERIAQFAAVHSISSGKCRLIFDGETEPTVKRYSRIASYEPTVNDRVMIVHNVIIGKLA